MIRKLFTRKIFIKVLNKINFFYRNLHNVDVSEFSNNNENILILSPHADDESIGCAGIILKYPSKIKVICITDGRYGDKLIEPNKMSKIREDEFKNAMKFAGINSYDFLKIEDSKIKENFRKFSLIDFDKYKSIFIPNYLDRHLDHKAVSNHIYALIKNGNISKNTDIYYYEVWNTVPIVNSYSNISLNIEMKRDMINLYHSQINNINYTDKIIALNKFRGLSLKVNFAETYMKLTTKEFLKFMESK
jgi:LmbE family N-acetylglucosaminyl deacetylase